MTAQQNIAFFLSVGKSKAPSQGRMTSSFALNMQEVLRMQLRPSSHEPTVETVR